MKRSATAICALFFFAAIATSQEQETPPSDAEAKEAADVALEIRATLQALHDARRQYRLASEKHRDELELVQRQIARLRDDVQRVLDSTQEQRKQIEQLKLDVAEQEEKFATAAAWIDLAAKASKPVAERAVDRMRFSFLSQRSRLASEMRQAIVSLDSQDPARRVEGFQRICSGFGSEWLPARQIHLANQTIATDDGDRVEHGWLFGVGSAAALFISENESTIGLWTGATPSPWLMQLEPPVASQARFVVDTVRQRRAPGLTAAPIWYIPAPAASND